MNLTIVLAIWGAALSTLLAIIEFFKFRRDKINLKIRVQGDYTVIPPNHPLNPYGEKSLILITAVNTGRRPIHITRAGLLLPKKKYLMASESVTTFKLNEGESQQYRLYEEGVAKDGLTPDKYVAFVLDSSGKYYYSHNFLKRLYKLRRIK